MVKGVTYWAARGHLGLSWDKNEKDEKNESVMNLGQDSIPMALAAK